MIIFAIPVMVCRLYAIIVKPIVTNWLIVCMPHSTTNIHYSNNAVCMPQLLYIYYYTCTIFFCLLISINSIYIHSNISISCYNTSLYAPLILIYLSVSGTMQYGMLLCKKMLPLYMLEFNYACYHSRQSETEKLNIVISK